MFAGVLASWQTSETEIIGDWLLAIIMDQPTSGWCQPVSQSANCSSITPLLARTPALSVILCQSLIVWRLQLNISTGEYYPRKKWEACRSDVTQHFLPLRLSGWRPGWWIITISALLILSHSHITSRNIVSTLIKLEYSVRKQRCANKHSEDEPIFSSYWLPIEDSVKPQYFHWQYCPSLLLQTTDNSDTASVIIWVVVCKFTPLFYSFILSKINLCWQLSSLNIYRASKTDFYSYKIN